MLGVRVRSGVRGETHVEVSSFWRQSSDAEAEALCVVSMTSSNVLWSTVNTFCRLFRRIDTPINCHMCDSQLILRLSFLIISKQD